MSEIFDPALHRRIVEFSNQLVCEGYSRIEQLAVLGGLIATNLRKLPPTARRLAIKAHLAALQDVES